MSSPENFLIEEQPRFERTVNLLRKLKDAATKDLEPSAWQQTRTWFGRVLKRSNDLEKNNDLETTRQTALKDSIQLAQIAADFFISRISSASHEYERSTLDQSLERFGRELTGFEPRSNSSSSSAEAGGSLRAGFLYGIATYGQEFIEAHMLGYNNLGAASMGEFLTSDVGVFSPLATDYLLAETYRVYIKRFIAPQGFNLQPIALGRYQERGVVSSEKELPFTQQEQLALFVDAMGSHTTRIRTLAILDGMYPGKKIHEEVNDHNHIFNPNSYGFSLRAETV